MSVSQTVAGALSSTATCPITASPLTGEEMVTDGLDDAPEARPVVDLHVPAAPLNAHICAAFALTAPDSVTVTLSAPLAVVSSVVT